MSTPPPSLIRVACVGDSITCGENTRTAVIDQSYPAMLGRLLGAGWEVRNFGVNGTTLLHRGDSPYIRTPAYAAALAFKPDLVVIKLGTNDSKRPRPNAPDAPDNWIHRSDYAANYHALIAAFRAGNPGVGIFACIPVPAYPGNWGIDDTTIREDIAPLVRSVAAETNATVIDLYAALSGRSDCFPDTVHPNEAGAALIAAEVHRHLASR